jgi:hypothetical protein
MYGPHLAWMEEIRNINDISAEKPLKKSALSIGRMIILKRILKQYSVRIWGVLNWFKTEYSG